MPSAPAATPRPALRLRPATASRRIASAMALTLAAALAAATPGPGQAREPLSDWLGALGDAAQALDRGDPNASLEAARRAAAALPRGGAASRAAASEGLALLEAGRPSEAVAPLGEARRGAAEAAAPVRQALDLALGRALLGAGRPVEAAPRLAEAAAGPAGGAARAARWLEPEALLSAGLLVQAAPRLEALLRDAPDDPRAPRARLSLAAAEWLLGRASRAAERYREVALGEPDRPEGAEAVEALARMQAGGAAARPPAGGPALSLDGDDRLARAERLLARGRHGEALAELDRAASTTAPAAPDRIELLRALALLAAGRPADAEPLARRLEGQTRDAGVRRGAAWVLARASGRAGRLDEAVGWYGRVARSDGPIPGLPERRWRELGDEAAYLSAWLSFDTGRFEQAVRRLEAFARARPGSPRADEARWFAAWARLRQGDRPGAAEAFARLSRANGSLADGAWYWQGRLATSPARARQAFERAAELGGDGWYAALASARLERLGPADRPAATSAAAARQGSARRAERGGSAPTGLDQSVPLASLELRDGPAAEALRAAAALLALGWRAAGLAELDDLSRRPGARTVAGPLAELAAFAGDTELPFRVARDLLGTTPRTRRWLYPAPARDQVAERAASAGVEAELVCAVIRRESAFQARARSAAGAEGLMQLLGPTASRLRAVTGLEPAAGGLSDGAQNAGLGAHYLALLLDRFGDDAVALAAYNAGPRIAAAWARDRAGLPLDEWVEAIPYRETRAYVKAVLAARQVYRRLAGLPAPLDPGRPVPPPAGGVAF